jgi:hypothetical protein
MYIEVLKENSGITLSPNTFSKELKRSGTGGYIYTDVSHMCSRMLSESVDTTTRLNNPSIIHCYHHLIQYVTVC